MRSESIYSDSYSNLMGRFDALHGYIDFRDASGSENGIIARLLKTRILERLRNVKQTGFAYQSYPSADHSRYAHSLGTMHMMRVILQRLSITGGLSDQLFKDLSTCFSEVFVGRREDDYEKLAQHLLVAALLQDVGEIPFKEATKHFCRPSYEVMRGLQDCVGFTISDWNEKDIFTIASIYRGDILHILDNLSLPFLVFLITGRASPDRKIESNLLQLREMLNGVIDADRLDYVFRDAHHTVGISGTPNAVVESLLYYDEKGPVFSDPGPVSNFLATRAYIHSTVYSAPANRFRVVLLVNFLQGLVKKDECAKEFFGGSNWGGLSFEAFQKMDDDYIISRIKEFASGHTKEYLGEKTRTALELLVGQGPDYYCFWLPPEEAHIEQPAQIDLPEDLYFDTFADQQRLLYRPGSVRVVADRFKQFGDSIPLEKCGGPLSVLFRTTLSTLPMPESILLFAPKERKKEIWKKFDQILTKGGLHSVLINSDPFGPTDFPADTRELPGFSGPNIFISFSWNDVNIVRRIANILYEKRRRYFLLIKAFQGIGQTTSQNSIKCVEQADVVLMIASKDYCKRSQELPDGNIAKEIYTMTHRIKANEDLKIIPLSVDDFRELKSKLPWSQLGFEEVPFVGKSLSRASDNDLEEAISVALATVD